MAARPPQSDDSEEPDVIAFGIPVVESYLDGADVEFPATADELVAALGNPDVPYDARGRTVSLDEALDRTGRDRFDTQRELLNELHPVFEELRTAGGAGLVDWLKSFLP